MTWEDILKIDMAEARRLGDKYSPDDMEQDRKRKMLKKIAERIPMIKQIVEKYKDINEESTIEYGNLLMSLMEGLPITAPRLVKRTDSESKMKNYNLVKEFVNKLEDEFVPEINRRR